MQNEIIDDKKYNHKNVEKNINKKWIDKKFFSTHDETKKPFCIILPPPNVTGKLHLGHAWDGFIQDSIIRYKKIQGFDVLFLPATDHAGIATQTKVEQKLIEENIDKHLLGREKFLEKAFEWKDLYAGIIKEQWNKLGLALDYTNERFTLDPEANKAVNKIFIDLYNKGLIYRDKKPINWDIKLKTAISNIEVINKEKNSKMYYIKYFLENENDFITIATTRIETIFSDVAIAFNPEDKNKNKYLNKKVINPLTKNVLPIITDDYIKIDFGSGFMKVSAHAVNDIDIIKKNNLEIKECINEDGKLNDLAGDFKGLSREEAREKIEIFLRKNDLIVEIKNIKNNIGVSERTNEVIEILVKSQWFLKMKPFSELVLNNLNSKDKVEIIPKRFEKILKHWMKDTYDWNLSRQLWWGHRIPVWYKGEEILVQETSPGKEWVQDEDVLDTWFSSGIAPFSFLGWPNEEKFLKRFFPTSILVTGYDIIFFWVARMYFFSLEFMNEIPFNKLLLHGLIKDEQGRKMSKSLGNGIDPMEVIDKYGSDSLRWFLLTNSSPGNDINYSPEKINNAWALCNKLWNINRYIINMPDDNNTELFFSDKWINSKLFNLEKNIKKFMEKFNFSFIGKEISNFIYNDFSSYYVEFLKVNPNKKNAKEILEKLLIMIHPFLPFITDKLYLNLTEKELLESTEYELKNYSNVSYIDRAIEIIDMIKNFRNTYNISVKEKVFFNILKINEKNINELIKIVNKLVNAETEENNGVLYKNSSLEISIKLSDELIKMEQEKLLKEKAFIEEEIKRANNILSNEKFILKAPKDKVKIEQEKLILFKEKLILINKKIKG
ncbi:MAG: valine--tRNA ligase [Metamycoplasmataceae bacterium]